MQRGRGGRDNFLGLGGPFAGFGGHGSLISSVFGGRDPFDDPFFTRPFEGSPFGSMFGSSFFGASGSPFVDAPAEFLEHQQSIPHAQTNKHRGPIIEELDSDEEKAKDGDGSTNRKDKTRKNSRSGKKPYVEDPDDDTEEDSNKNAEPRKNIMSQPKSQSFTFHSSTVTYGGTNGTYYTKSSTRRTGSDGVTYEENKEADSTTGRAFHQVSRGLHNKGHTLARNLNSDGRVETMETLHNLNEDELVCFEKAWKGKAKKHLPGISERLTGHNNDAEATNHGRGGWALPSNEHSQSLENGKKKRARTRKEAKAPPNPRA